MSMGWLNGFIKNVITLGILLLIFFLIAIIINFLGR